MSNLLEHFRKMQVMAAAYLKPEPYVQRYGTTDGNVKPGEQFISDMIYMLDGLEQREAEAEYGELVADRDQQLANVKALNENVGMLRERCNVVTGERNTLRDEVNELRSRMMGLELEHAKLRGYLDRILDEQPPAMVPEQREPRYVQFLGRGTRDVYKETIDPWFKL